MNFISKFFSRAGFLALAFSAFGTSGQAATCQFGDVNDFTLLADVYTSTNCVSQISGNDSAAAMTGIFGITNWTLDSRWDQTLNNYSPSGILSISNVTGNLFQGDWSVSSWAGVGAAALVLKGANGWAAYLLDTTAGLSGSWITQALTNNGGNQPAISHISLYTTTLTAVPLPATGLLLIGSIGGLGFAARRRKT